MDTIGEIKSPFDGIILPIENIPDPVFAGKMVGDGFAIEPMSKTLKSPVNGEVILLHKALHAITLRTAEGLELLIHIGIDTVNLKGEGFKALVKQGDSVQIGTPLIELDLDFLAINAKSLVTPVIILNADQFNKSEINKPFTFLKTGEEFFKISHIGPFEVKNSSSEKEVSKTIKLINPQGLHARPCAHLVSLAKSFDATIYIEKNTNRVSALSLVSLLSLEAAEGDTLTIYTNGNEATKALEEIAHYIENHKETPLTKVESIKSQSFKDDHQNFYGQIASDGYALGKITVLETAEITIPTHIGKPEVEKISLDSAIEVALKELDSLKEKMTKEFGADKANIFEAHKEILKDPELINEAQKLIFNEKNNAAQAWFHAFNKTIEMLEKLNDTNLAARAADVKDVGQRVLRKLVSHKDQEETLQNVGMDTILVARDLTPSDTAKLDKTKIKGFITCHGGTTSHVAIIARSLGIPAIVGANEKILDIAEGTDALLNAVDGKLELHISNERKDEIKVKIKSQEEQLAKDIAKAHAPAITKDSTHIEVAANVTGLKDVENAVEMGCDGVGLLRTEFIFMDRDRAPTVKEQIKIYQDMIDALSNPSNKPLIIRTLDVGGDKPLTYLPIDKEENPFLGERGIRVSLNKKDIFKDQLEAILKTKNSEEVHIMFPMISRLDELLEAKEILKEVQEKCHIEKVKVGMMVEVPSAALMAEVYAPHVDFFSIGANDLTQYTVAIDRGHPKLASFADGLCPSVLKLIHMTCEAAKKHNTWVGVCGGIASDLHAVPILLGLGVTELSVSIPMIPKVKAKVRELSLSDCEVYAGKCLTLNSAKEVRNFKL